MHVTVNEIHNPLSMKKEIEEESFTTKAIFGTLIAMRHEIFNYRYIFRGKSLIQLSTMFMISY